MPSLDRRLLSARCGQQRLKRRWRRRYRDRRAFPWQRWCPCSNRRFAQGRRHRPSGPNANRCWRKRRRCRLGRHACCRGGDRFRRREQRGRIDGHRRQDWLGRSSRQWRCLDGRCSSCPICDRNGWRDGNRWHDRNCWHDHRGACHTHRSLQRLLVPNRRCWHGNARSNSVAGHRPDRCPRRWQAYPSPAGAREAVARHSTRPRPIGTAWKTRAG